MWPGGARLWRSGSILHVRLQMRNKEIEQCAERRWYSEHSEWRGQPGEWEMIRKWEGNTRPQIRKIIKEEVQSKSSRQHLVLQSKHTFALTQAHTQSDRRQHTCTMTTQIRLERVSCHYLSFFLFYLLFFVWERNSSKHSKSMTTTMTTKQTLKTYNRVTVVRKYSGPFSVCSATLVCVFFCHEMKTTKRSQEVTKTEEKKKTTQHTQEDGWSGRTRDTENVKQKEIAK